MGASCEIQFSSNRWTKIQPTVGKRTPMVTYLISKEAAYCNYCILFGVKSNLSSIFQHSGFTDWKNAKGTKRGALTWHEASESHKTAAIMVLSFKEICEGKLQGIQSCVSKEHDEQIKRNTQGYFDTNYRCYHCIRLAECTTLWPPME